MGNQFPPSTAELLLHTPETVSLPSGTVFWRIHKTVGSHVVPWNALRTFGPLESARWDPHPPPPGDKAPLGSIYVGSDVAICLAEFFQLSRFVDVDQGSPYITGFELAAEVTVLDLTGSWILSAGGSAQVMFQEKVRTRAWAQAVHDAWDELDGVIAPSAMFPGRNVTVLWNTQAMPGSPMLSVPLNSPAIIRDIATEAMFINYTSNIVF